MILNQLRNRALAVSAFLLLSALSANAQSSATYNLAAIHFTGLQRYTAEQGIAASGLHIGASIALGDLQSAAQRLSQSGAFDSVSFQYSTRANDLTAKFGVTETKGVLPCIFDNFVWFSDADLDRELRRRVPLYTGESPVRGDTVDQIRGALQDFLRANGISGDVSEIPCGPFGKLVGLLFHVDGISQPIKSIAFSGEAAVSDKQLLVASTSLANQEFSVTNVASYASSALLPLCYERGYLRSQFGRAKVSPLDPNSKGPATEVSITLPVVEGNQYSWNGATWSGNRALSTGELIKALGINQQEVANQLKIDAGFANARKTYLSQGYINVQIDPQRALDDAAKLASYSVQISEGSQFRMGKIVFEGLPEAAAAALVKKWKLQPGDVYDATYPLDFLKNTAPQVLAQQDIMYHTVATKETPDPSALLVNVRIQFR
ncbi:MAG: POTRA domain-containing protein [Candidatus Acidiferrales bacterium]